ncbi:hypothetical protein DIURU_001096 [Diutina rugosa]|uniref:Cell division control protein 50 n=1 Tax=Diutina rugosa TaxID=5481 RepID=A0A642UVM1_DIURU|nr:uncharacterized protein DIURU_001096 [Diutina rugosa]KAA8906358.1 hypothetical protein DIURU_001096 [Diutina rugosa]
MPLRSRRDDTDIPQSEGVPYNDNHVTIDGALDPNREAEDSMDDDDDDSLQTTKELKLKSHRPPNNAFTQQRLKAVNPVLTARTVIPLLFAIAIVFVPLGAAMWYASHVVQDIEIDYTYCENITNTDYWAEIPGNYTFRFKNNASVVPPVWKLDHDPQWGDDEAENKICRIQFQVPVAMDPPILFFYKLKNFHANHRRYVKSFSEDQIKGKAADLSKIRDQVGQNCKPLVTNAEGKIYYPCGLIANSMFNDTYSPQLTAVNGTTTSYPLTNKGIAWSSDKNRFKKTTYPLDQIVPPPNWHKVYPDGYNESNIPDIQQWEEFQNWMSAAGLPTFNKLALRNPEKTTLQPGFYEVAIGMHWPVQMFKGHKYIYISTRSAIGGKNIFLGVVWMAGGGLCFLLALGLLIVNFIKPRRAGDPNLLSWNKAAIKQE